MGTRLCSGRGEIHVGALGEVARPPAIVRPEFGGVAECPCWQVRNFSHLVKFWHLFIRRRWEPLYATYSRPGGISQLAEKKKPPQLQKSPQDNTPPPKTPPVNLPMHVNLKPFPAPLIRPHKNICSSNQAQVQHGNPNAVMPAYPVGPIPSPRLTSVSDTAPLTSSKYHRTLCLAEWASSVGRWASFIHAHGTQTLERSSTQANNFRNK
ncbi:hypothetical protein M407DRAFT_167152 [Tulasnella calospora MUT 4182]|uniref:Uncharacterized protein n=1 Tax=Tulasnella calospora MUT 4182 TaxID=1051891 RepID=A0A0C3QQ23_9AGAM|nr:hypothetical protein M407DRAFT_167152 [Tulasnella calospora MUT 4182]